MEHLPKIIGVCLSTLYNENRYGFISKLNKHAVDNGYRLMVFNADSDLFEQYNPNNNGAATVFRLIPYEQLSAIIIFPSFIHNKEIIQEIIENSHNNNIPVITIDKKFEGCSCFSFSYADAFEELCRHTIEKHGARNVYLITGPEGNVYAEERRAAYRRALEANNIPYDENNVGYGGFWENPTNDILMKWFDIEKREIPDAIICANDIMAITTSNFLQNRGYNIPDECIITGFDNIEQAEIHTPRLTTCIQDYDAMGKLLIEEINAAKNGRKMNNHVRVGFNMIFSESCGCEGNTTQSFNMAMRRIINRNYLSNQRQVMMCSMQSSISKMTTVEELPSIIVDKFGFHTIIMALNDDAFTPPLFGVHRKGKASFSKKINILYQRYYWYNEEPCTIDFSKLIPDYELMTKRNEPIIVCAVHFMDMTMGYCVFQPEIDIDEYQKIHAFVTTLGAALGNFHGKMHVNFINEELIDANKELRILSQRDFMTGLFNRRGFFDRLEKAFKEEIAEKSKIVIISADLDKLKYINDTFGHHEGDNAINTVSRALVSSSVQEEICARFGGDEFCVAAIVNAEEAPYYFDDFKDRFCDYLYDYNRKSGKEYTVNASIGCCVEEICGEINIEDMIKIADENMYIDKMEHRRKTDKI
ncbi:MAG: GGDEF domain-containing protein [Ruminococcus sp.]|nr:GGDEF domain-containing protein [Ruminococcus sp.]